MVLFWGPELVALYNDAYATAIGDRHPGALGGKAADKWAHIWDRVGPILVHVRESGMPQLVRDQACGQRGLVQDGRRGLPERVRRDPRQGFLSPGLPQLAAHVG